MAAAARLPPRLPPVCTSARGAAHCRASTKATTIHPPGARPRGLARPRGAPPAGARPLGAGAAYFMLELGPFFLPRPTTTLTNRRLYTMRLRARPAFFFGLSAAFATFGVWPRTLPARASDP